MWTRTILGHEVQGWWWDTVIGGKTLDYRPGNSNVAFQAYTRLGVLGFKDETDNLLKAESVNALNRIKDVPTRSLMERNALDSALEFGIALHQRKEMGY